VNPWDDDERRVLRDTARRFVETEVLPHQDRWEREGELPRSLHEKAGALGMLGAALPVEVGGGGGDLIDAAVIAEEMHYAGCSGGTFASLFTCGIAVPHMASAGDPRQIERWVKPTLAGDKIGSLAITEPGGGSDVGHLRTRADRDGDHYVVNGAKTFITSGCRADYVVTAARTGDDGAGGVSLLVVEKDAPGFTVSRKLEKMGWHASDTAELSFSGVEVPEENLLGEENRGFYLIMENFAWERLSMALGAVGAMRRLLDVALSYAGEREAFGRPIGRFQAIRHKIAEIATKAEVGRALTFHALRRFAAGQDVVADVTKAKLFTQRACVQVADECVQILGGYGYMREYGVERALRDARLGPIGGGTDEVMKEILGRQLGL
jgi:acyl-CoA dehydrogenase